VETIEDGINLHPAPLQSVWPVQEKATESDLSEPVQASTPYQSGAQVDRASTYAAPKAHSMERTTLSQDFGQIQSRLEQVRTIPSDSSIEYIPPRRPHPLSQPTQPAKPANLLQRQPEDADQHTQPVQTEAESRSFESEASFEKVQPFPTGIQEEHSPEPVDKLPIAPALPLQRFKDESSSPEMVGTQIGSLPADLWQLIGENPPAREPSAPAAIHSPAQSRPKQMQNSASQVMRAPDSSFTAQADSPSHQSQAIQHQAEPTAAPVQAVAGREPASREDQEEPADQEVDIQELAKKVYSEIKQKLALEWERRRF
jgi:hypothetical protein